MKSVLDCKQSPFWQTNADRSFDSIAFDLLFIKELNLYVEIHRKTQLVPNILLDSLLVNIYCIIYFYLFIIVFFAFLTLRSP